ncbi:MAG: hypothetical protein IJM30_02225 [Thermoguttaceae bacterium]|nr:hypothetical protein [Thermoguttaceae bacterium]
MTPSRLDFDIDDASANVEVEDDFRSIDDQIDPLDVDIAAYLDGELSPEEKAAFEAKVDADPDLKARLEEERDAWEALDLLDVDDSDQDLTESVVERLNSETQTELNALKKSLKKRRLLFGAASGAILCAAFLAGWGLFSALFPNLNERRARDFRIVERCAQLAAVEDFEYLKALKDSKAFDEPDPSGKSRLDPVFEKVLSGAGKKSFAELSQDRAFYLRQIRFERLDKEEQKRLRALYAQIENAPDSEELWRIADVYLYWTNAALSDFEKNELREKTIPERLEFIRQRRKRYRETRQFLARENVRDAGEPETRQFPERSGSRGRDDRDDPEDAPMLQALRQVLPETLRNEKLDRIRGKYDDFSRQNKRAEQGGNLVLDFIEKTSSSELLELLSPNARDYLRSLSDENRDDYLGALVSISLLEKGEDSSERVRERRFDRGNRGLGANFFWFNYRPEGVSTKDLAFVLKNAPDPAKSFAASQPPEQAVMMLYAMYNANRWRGFDAQNDLGRQNPERFANRPSGDPSPSKSPPFGFAPPPNPNIGRDRPDFWKGGISEGGPNRPMIREPREPGSPPRAPNGAPGSTP